MTTRWQIAPLLAVLALVVAVMVGGAAGAVIAAGAGSAATTARPAASPSTANRVGDLAGGWRMTSLEVADDGQLLEVPYSGQITFDPTGRVAVQAMNPDIAAADTEFTVNGYEAWAGQGTVDQTASTFTARVDSAVTRDMIGTDQARRYQITGDTLELTPADGSGAFRATYERY